MDVTACHVELAFEDLRVGRVADRDEHAVRRDILRLATVNIRHAHADDTCIVAEHVADRVIPKQPHVAARTRLRDEAVDQDRLGAQLVAPMDQRDVARDVRQIQRFFDGRVPAADDDHILTFVEESVARRTRRYAPSHVRLLRRQPEIAGRCTSGDDQCVARVLGTVADELQRPRAQIHRMDVIEDELGLETLGVLLEPCHQVGAHYAVEIGGPVVDLGGRHQLPALREAGDDDRSEIGSRGVYCRGVAGGSGTQDQQAGVLRRHGILVSAKPPKSSS